MNRRAKRDTGGPRGTTALPGVVSSGRGSIAIGGDLTGIASTGKNATLVQIQLVQGAGEIHTVPDLTIRAIPILTTFREDEPVGRATIIEQTAATLIDGSSVQLYGAHGVGKKAIMRAVVRRLGTNRIPGVELARRAGEPHDLETIYERLTAAFFGVTTYRPPEPVLRSAAAGLTAHIVIGDCELPGEDLASLRATFPNCVFLLTSHHRTLFRAGSAHEVEPLSRPAAVELITQEVGRDPLGVPDRQLDEAYRLADGHTQRLLQYAAFLKSVGDRPGRAPHTDVGAEEQAAILASGLSEAARRVLVALATFEVELVPSHFAAVTGHPDSPEAETALLEAGTELFNARLVTRVGAAYRIAPDAAAAVHTRRWDGADPIVAAEGLTPLLAGGRAGSARPDPSLLLAVARALKDAHHDQQASRFVRAAAPVTLAAGRVQVWAQLVALGVQAATAAGRTDDLEYFLREEHTRARLQGDDVAAVAAVAALAALASSHSSAPAAHGVARTAGHVLRHGRKVLSFGHSGGAAAVAGTSATAVTIAVATVAAVVLTGRHSAKPPAPLTGVQLASALVPATGFSAGFAVSSGSERNSGSRLAIAPATRDLATMKCVELFPFSFVGGFTPGFGETSFANDSVDKQAGNGELFVNQAIYQFASSAKATAFFTSLSSVLSTCTHTVTTLNGDRAIGVKILLPIRNAGGGFNPITTTAPLFVLHGTDVFAVAPGDIAGTTPPATPSPASLVAKLIANVEALEHDRLDQAAAAWTITFQRSPTTPFTGNAARFTDSAQYPVLSGIADPTQRRRLNDTVQQPIVAWNEQVASNIVAVQKAQHSTVAPGGLPSETTTVTRAGPFVSFTYVFTVPGDSGAEASRQTLVVRSDTATTVPEATILTPQARTQQGAAQIAAAYRRLNPSLGATAGDCPVTTAAFVTALNALGTARAGSLQLAVTPTGIGLHYRPGARTCGLTETVIPFGELSGLVDPRLATLAAEQIPAQVAAVPSPTAPTATTTAPAAPPTPATVVADYIAAINAHDYHRAWQLGGKNIGERYATFANGFGTTRHDTLSDVSFQGDTVTATLSAEQTDGTTQTYAFTFTVSGDTITAFEVHQTG